MLRAGGDAVAQGVAVGVGACDAARDGRVVGDGEVAAARTDIERWAGVGDADVDGLRRDAAVAVRHAQHEAVGADVVAGGVGVAAGGGIEGDGAVLRAGGDAVAQGVAVGVGACDAARDGRVVGDGEVAAARTDIERWAGVGDADVDGLRRDAAVTVGDAQHEAVGTDVVAGGVGVAAGGGIDGDGAVLWAGGERVGERIAVGVGGDDLSGHSVVVRYVERGRRARGIDDRGLIERCRDRAQHAVDVNLERLDGDGGQVAKCIELEACTGVRWIGQEALVGDELAEHGGRELGCRHLDAQGIGAGTAIKRLRETGGLRGIVAEHIAAGSAEQRIVARAAAQRVVAVAAFQPVCGTVADQRVIQGAGLDVLEVGDRVGASRIAGDVRLPSREIDGEPVWKGRIVDRIGAVAAVEGVRAVRADDRIVAVAPLDHVVVAVAGEDVVAAAADDVLETGDRIPLCQAARHGARGQIDGHAGRVVCVRQRIDACAADQRVGTRSSRDDIVSRPSVDAIAPGAAAQLVRRRVARDRVVLERPDCVLDVGERGRAEPGDAAGGQVDVDGRCCG